MKIESIDKKLTYVNGCEGNFRGSMRILL